MTILSAMSFLIISAGEDMSASVEGWVAGGATKEVDR